LLRPAVRCRNADQIYEQEWDIFVLVGVQPVATHSEHFRSVVGVMNVVGGI